RLPDRHHLREPQLRERPDPAPPGPGRRQRHPPRPEPRQLPGPRLPLRGPGDPPDGRHPAARPGEVRSEGDVLRRPLLLRLQEDDAVSRRPGVRTLTALGAAGATALASLATAVPAAGAPPPT